MPVDIHHVITLRIVFGNLIYSFFLSITAATVGFNNTILTEMEGGWGVVELCAVLENLPSAGLGSQLTLQLERINIKSGNNKDRE